MRTARVVLALCLLSALAACGGGGGLRADKSAEAFSLRVLDASIQDSTTGQYYIDTNDEAGGERQVDIYATDAAGLKALYVELSYDQSAWHLVEAAPASAFGADAISLSGEIAPGVLQYGQVLPGYDERAGFSGSGKLATLRFAAGAATARTTASATAAAAESSSGKWQPAAAGRSASASGPAVELSWDPSSNTLSWPYGAPGDYDQNGEVNVADLSPLGRFFGQSGGFDASDLRSQVDGDANGEINLADLTPIGANFGTKVEGYRVFFTTLESSLPQVGQEDAAGLAKDLVKFETLQGAAAVERLHFEYAFAGAAPNGWVWVRPGLNPPDAATFYGEASVVLRLGSAVPDNELPLASFTADPLSGIPPLTVSFDAAGSSDPDGSIASYEWDWDGDANGWSWEPAGDPQAEHVFEAEGSHNVTLRVTDNSGASAFAYQVVNVSADPDLPPTGVFSIADGVLRKGHEITFDVDELYDPEGTAIDLEWDLNGDGLFIDYEWFDEYIGMGHYQAKCAYPEAGSFVPRVKLIDGHGLATILSLAIVIEGDLPPTAVVKVTPSSGSAPLTLDLDGSASTDDFTNGVDGIMGLQWKIDCLTDPDLSHSLYVAWDPGAGHSSDTLLCQGEYEITLEVSDAAGQSSVASTHVTVSGTGMHTAVFDTGDNCDWVSGEVVAGRPAVVYKYSVGMGSTATFELRFARAIDSLGEKWAAPVVIDPKIGFLGGSCSLVDLDGKPAIAWYSYKDLNIYFSHALDSEGQSWSAPCILSENLTALGNNPVDLEMIAGKLSVLCCDNSHVIFRQAEDPLGQSWGAAHEVWTDNDPGWAFSLCDVAGQPALIWSDLRYMRYCRASDPAGQTWPEPKIICDIYYEAANQDVMTCDLKMVAGAPACYFAGYLVRALDPLGESWTGVVDLEAGAWASTLYSRLEVVDGKPLAIDGYIHSRLLYCNDATGENWQEPVALFDSTGSLDLIDLNNVPGIFHNFSFSTIR